MHKGHLDNNEEQIKDTLGMNDIISVLRNEFSNIYLVDCKSQQIEIYRYKNQAVGVKEILQTKQPYKAAIQKYIESLSSQSIIGSKGMGYFHITT